MVMCKYYLNGNCRYGTKCMNEHFDIKQVIKTEIEAAVRGAQWPLSCFGPFKEKPCIPNFIEDQSFEEIRYQCYEAKARQTFDAFQQEFAQKIVDAQNKFKLILSFSRDVLNMVVNLYNGIENDQNKPINNNPFASGANLTNANKKSDIFGGSIQQQQSNPFGNSQGFGNVGNTNTFGNPNQGNVGGNLFNQNTFGVTNTFGNNQSTFNTGNTVGFGNQQQLQQSTANSFSFVPNNNFGQMQHEQRQQVSNTNSIFGVPTSFENITNINAFGNNSTSQSISGGNLFNQPQQIQNAGMNFAQQQLQNQNNAFTQSQQQHQLQQPNMFQNAVQTQPQVPTGNVFGIVQSSEFNNMQQNNIQQNSFLNQGNSFNNQNANQQNMFQQMLPATQYGAPTIGNLNFPHSEQSSMISDKIYSKVESLNNEIIEAFRAPEFTLGKIPTVPPPREFCG